MRSQPKMVRLFVGLMIATAIVFAGYSFVSRSAGEPPKVARDDEQKGFAVVELFTSEGCSSCPSADDLVAKVLKEKQRDVYILSYHVDYWNRLGWTDQFSSEMYSARQKQYARFLGLDGIYTPQIVVNGKDQFVGSNENRLRAAIKNGLAGNVSALTVEATKTGKDRLHVNYTIAGSDAVFLNLTLVQPEAQTEVKAGENGGHILHHVDIVRALKIVEVANGTGSVDVEIPAALQNLPLKLFAFTQQKNTFAITGISAPVL